MIPTVPALAETATRSTPCPTTSTSSPLSYCNWWPGGSSTRSWSPGWSTPESPGRGQSRETPAA
ncbi:hypothetical protein QJS66_16315 [Kocuria rhizophila]|nr:hypothetical protein QJS66_16315 [Kocuria rhizophila]